LEIIEMEYVSIRQLRSSPANVLNALADTGEAVITNNGRPQALLIPVDSDNAEEAVLAVRQARAMRALHRQQLASLEAGRDTMSLDEINAEIAADRTGRRARQPARPGGAGHQRGGVRPDQPIRRASPSGEACRQRSSDVLL
jgi:prevent-host-death family protein